MSEIIRTAMIELWAMIAQMSPYLLLGFAVAGVLRVLISNRFVENHLGGNGIWPVFKSSMIGVPLPLCSCGVIPVAMSLRKQGASRGATVAFLLSTPQTGIDSIFVTFSLMGPVFMIFRPIIALVTGLIGGTAVNVFGEKKPDKQTQQDCDSCNSDGRENIITRAVKYGFVVLPKDIGPAMLGGLIIAAVISVGIPDDFFADKIGTGIGAMVLMMFVGIPVYVCATASVPVAVAMIAKGLTPGAALVFLMTGPATNAAAFITIWKILGTRTAVIYILTVMFCAVSSGALFDSLFSSAGEYITTHIHEMSPSSIEHISAIVLIVILGFGIFGKYCNKKSTRPSPKS